MKKKLILLIIVLSALILILGAALLLGVLPFGRAAPQETPAPTPPPTPSPEPTPAPTPVPTPTPDYPSEQLALTLDLEDRGAVRVLLDESYQTAWTFPAGTTITLTADRPIGSVYIRFGSFPGEWTLRAGDREIVCGREGFLHEYIPVAEAQTSVELVFSGAQSLMIRDIFAFSPGYPPPFVQTWQNLNEPADILVFSPHYDDELLFFGGLIPYYSAVRGLRVQVVYMTSNYLTDFSNYALRPHEALNGLWECGLTYYPVTNDAPDYVGRELNTLWDAQQQYGEDSFTEFQVEMIRRFKPLVAVTLAEDGEYGHGAHVLTALSLERAVQAAADPAEFPDSAARYGVWDTPKTYLHRWGYAENMTVLNYEQPSSLLGGRTPFQTAQDAYRLHLTQQQWVGFRVFGAGTYYDSHRFGLYRSLVGADEARDDLMENVSRDVFPAK